VDDCCDVETGFTELLEAVEIPGEAIGIVLAAIELVVSEVPCTGEEIIKLVVVFFGPAAGVAEFIVSFRTFFSGWKTIM
jgi:hypothetical protein